MQLLGTPLHSSILFREVNFFWNSGCRHCVKSSHEYTTYQSKVILLPCSTKFYLDVVFSLDIFDELCFSVLSCSFKENGKYDGIL